MTKLTLIAMVSMVSVLVSACASDKTPPPPEVKVVGDSYCKIAEKISWSKQDTPETIKGVLRENAKVDKTCGKGSPQRLADVRRK